MFDKFLLHCNLRITQRRVDTFPDQKISALTVWHCKQNAPETASKTNFTSKSQLEKPVGRPRTKRLYYVENLGWNRSGLCPIKIQLCWLIEKCGNSI